MRLSSKACGPLVEKRYQTAMEMHSELRRLREGASIRVSRSVERHLARLRKVRWSGSGSGGHQWRRVAYQGKRSATIQAGGSRANSAPTPVARGHWNPHNGRRGFLDRAPLAQRRTESHSKRSSFKERQASIGDRSIDAARALLTQNWSADVGNRYGVCAPVSFGSERIARPFHPPCSVRTDKRFLLRVWMGRLAFGTFLTGG